MAKWRDVRAQAVQEGRIDEARVEAQKRADRARVRAHRLAELRTAYGLNQTELAHRLGVSQVRVSRLERGDVETVKLGTLRALAVALGGDLEVIVRVGDERIQIA